MLRYNVTTENDGYRNIQRPKINLNVCYTLNCMTLDITVTVVFCRYVISEDAILYGILMYNTTP